MLEYTEQVEIVPYDDGLPGYDGLVFDLFKVSRLSMEKSVQYRLNCRQ